MAVYDVSAGNSLYYEHHAPERDGAPTFVFVNALTGNTQAWEAVVAPTLRAEGFGTLSYNFRGQDGSEFTPETALAPDLIVSDLTALVEHINPGRIILVGLSIGGLFAAHAWFNGLKADGLVLLNTLREIGPRLSWVNDAMPMVVGAGGVPLFLDAIFPLLVNPEFAQAARPNFLKGEYAPLDPAHGHANLMQHAGAADWEIDYSALTLPTLVVTGLHDRVFYDAEVVDRLYALLPDARRETWDDAGHLLPQERPQKLAASLLTFGREIEAKV
ncbi:MAG: alpha/beta hydrolase [Pseudomonadota bacterium]